MKIDPKTYEHEELDPLPLPPPQKKKPQKSRLFYFKIHLDLMICDLFLSLSSASFRTTLLLTFREIMDVSNKNRCKSL